VKRPFLFTIFLSIFLTLILQAQEKPEIFVQLGHAGKVQSVDFSPNGDLIVSASDDKTIKLWDTDTGRLVKTLSGHSHFVRCVAFSSDGTLVASGSVDRTIKLWNVSTGAEVATLEGHKDTISGLAFSPDGKYLASSAVNDTETKLWDIKTRTEARSIENQYSFSNVEFSPDGRYLALVGSWLRIFDLQKGEIAQVIKHFSPTSVSFSPDGELLACGGGGGLSLLNARSGEVVKQISKKTMIDTAYSPDGKYILSSSYDETARLWDVQSGLEIRAFEGHKDDILSLAFSPDGQQIITGSADFTVKLWDVEGGTEVQSYEGRSASVNSILYSPSGRFIISGSADKTIKIWDLMNARQDTVLSGHSEEVSSVAVSSDGRQIISLAYDKKMTLWDAVKKEKLRDVRDDLYSAGSVSISPNDSYIIVGKGLRGPKLFDLESGTEIREFAGKAHFYIHKSAGTSVQKEEARFTILSASFSPDGKYIVSGTDDGTLRLWDTKHSEEIYSIIAHSDDINAAIWSYDGRYIFSGSSDKTIKMWRFVEDVGFFKLEKTFETESHTVAALALSPNGRYLVSASHDRTLKLWDIQTGENLRTFEGHKSTVRSVVFSPDGRFIVSGSWDTTAKIWEVGSGREIAMLVGFDGGEWVIVTPQGYYNSSPNGARQLNVRVKGEIYSIDNYAEKFFRPDIVKAALTGVKLQGMSKLEDIKSPPKVTITTVEKVREDTARIFLEIEDTGGGIGDVRIFLNDSAIVLDNGRGLKFEKDRWTFKTSYTVKIANGLNKISAVAFNDSNTMRSDQASKLLKAEIRKLKKPSLYAVVIGINEYDNPNLRLQYAVPDALLMAETLREVTGPLFDKIHIKLLKTKDETTRENILKATEAFRSLDPEDLFVFYVASHGLIDDGKYFLITSNVGSTSTRKLEENAIDQEAIKSLIANVPTSKKLIIIDTCNSQALGESLQVALLTRGLTEDTAIKVLSRAVGVTILSATKSTQEALEGYKDHGLFTYVIVEGLKGKADYDRDGFIKTFELADYVDNEVPALAEEVFKRAQYPTVSPAGQGFPIAKVSD
jgi:WD40 repeat protein